MSVSQSSTDTLSAGAAATETLSDAEPAGVSKVSSQHAGPAGLTRPPASRQRDIQRILGLSVPVTVVLAERDMQIGSVLDITVGTIIEFDVAFDAELTLQVGNRRIGTGQGVKVGENFGLRISAVGTVQERIDALGAERG
jgi:flagellar motor switch/type III secretory pathway protein FliN